MENIFPFLEEEIAFELVPLSVREMKQKPVQEMIVKCLTTMEFGIYLL